MSAARRSSRRLRRLEEASYQMQAESDASIPVDEGSWRMVEGEHESFDTTILPPSTADDADDAEDAKARLVPLSSGQPSSGLPSQVSAQGNMAMSQDSIRDFVKHQDDDQVILREPFRPSVVSSVSSPGQETDIRTPEPQFKMPLMEVDGSRRIGDSSRAMRPLDMSMSTSFEDEYEGRLVRRREPESPANRAYRRIRRKRISLHEAYPDSRRREEGGGHASRKWAALGGRVAAPLPSALLKILVWAGEIVFIALQFAKYPLGLLMALYLVFGSGIIVQNMATRSVYSAISPICRLPGLSLLHLPFCPPRDMGDFGDPTTNAGRSVEFDDLMGVQSKFEQVLEHSAEGVSLPLEMKRSELAVRDLRSLVRHSNIQARHELVLEFDGYIDTARQAATDLQKFNTHVGSAVDAVISINRWTSRYIDSLAPESEEPGSSLLVEWTQWIFSPFQPADQQIFSERIILDKYIEHTSLVSQRISSLILEAQAVLRLLTKAEDHLELIYDITSRTSASVSSRRGEILWSVWTLVGANSGRLQSLSKQLSLLQQVDAQRSTAVKQVSALILELESIQASLGDLRDRVVEPQLSSVSSTHIPLSVHIETIDRGVERLQAARKRIRAAEDDRVRNTVAGLQNSHGPNQLIEAGRGN
ncbi:hypothetical protein E4U54_000450 [Claviceps lovelessii]|nr:hypothetical protein E4U54_000450 [Claviceps lovelessii]